MNNFFKIIILFSLGLTAISCSKSDNDTEPLRDYAEQKIKDMENIETFMKTHYMTVVNNPGGTDDLDVTYTKIPTGGTQISIWDQTIYPKQTREVTVRQNDVDITYTIYYLKLREGSGPNSKSPCNVDRVLTAYKGEYIYNSVVDNVSSIISNEFETLVNPQSFFSLTGVIRGWSEIFPKFKTGSYISNPDGTVSYSDFGAGVMFIPSGLAYYASPSGGIPTYSPLVFNFKLYEIDRVDNDGDGIFSYLEDLNNDGYVIGLPEGVVNPDDTDGDEIPDFIDTDDDGDFFTTRSETSYVHPNDVLETIRYYPFDGVAVDDPTTPYVDESKGVPNCSNDFTTPNRLRKYRDPSCH
ncbi:FKBP-type peptidyl-prolyl cis-trans isomerase [Flavobacterium sp. 25HG05S-40]|uniref:FKBP-type peptidyl-prolyl cis-trans isomerase n=1 Tax=Flavobacterium sp. 25HG05S-40 TaxID=3458682 RepID=UPI00404427A7